MKLKISFFAVAVQWLGASAISAPTHSKRASTVGQAVNTFSGVVVGHPAANRTGVSEYLGIPFAQPPVGNLRFAAPVPFRGNGSSITAAKYVRVASLQRSSNIPTVAVSRVKLTPASSH
jgi:hypothetical protein